MQHPKTPILPLTDAEESEIQAEIAGDPDASEATDIDLAQARPFAELFPHLAAKNDSPPAKSGPSRRKVSVLLDRDIVEKFQAAGPDWQERMTEVLKRANLGK